ncbi:hypothetical protein CYMTET_25769 [Cymbomonas tetramitiformis]|uniref:Peptidase S8/S53 domain-containing protein n=1 Tax=Cymbomonas tetramitiformis TaxID=36881 RepID=A0AAE0FTR9_9CHLO|nr:hypothetical protein CYMTET_25769 [Cymbomonas tetramitiformis]
MSLVSLDPSRCGITSHHKKRVPMFSVWLTICALLVPALGDISWGQSALGVRSSSAGKRNSTVPAPRQRFSASARERYGKSEQEEPAVFQKNSQEDLKIFESPAFKRHRARARFLGEGLAPVFGSVDDASWEADHPGSTSTKGRIGSGWILVWNASTTFEHIQHICAHLSDYIDSPGCKRTYSRVFRGLSVNASEPELIALLQAYRSEIEYVERDIVVMASEMRQQTSSVPWGLDRADSRTGLDGVYNYDLDGTGAYVYILDTGIRTTHQDFAYADGQAGSRAAFAQDFIGDGNGGSDCNGHGTHCAGSAGGLLSGIAKNAQIRDVRVLDCDGFGSLSEILAALDWVEQNHVAPAVVSMSLASSASLTMDVAAADLVAAGIMIMAAAGNEDTDACGSSPAREDTVITVGSVDSNDQRSWFSNYGTCVNIFAAGSSVASAAHTSDSAFVTQSGTSMATPQVAGAAALYLQSNPSATTGELRAAVIGAATENTIGDVQGSANLLLYTFFAPVTISPVSVSMTEGGSSVAISVTLQNAPSSDVQVAVLIDDLSEMSVAPSQLTFTASSWASSQALQLTPVDDTLVDGDVVLNIVLSFSSSDAQYDAQQIAVPAVVYDNEICGTCGNTLSDPKIIPSLPIYYRSSTAGYSNNYVVSCPYWSYYSGRDVVFQYTPPQDTTITISTCAVPRPPSSLPVARQGCRLVPLRSGGFAGRDVPMPPVLATPPAQCQLSGMRMPDHDTLCHVTNVASSTKP